MSVAKSTIPFNGTPEQEAVLRKLIAAHKWASSPEVLDGSILRNMFPVRNFPMMNIRSL